MKNLSLLPTGVNASPDKYRCVVRVKTSYYESGGELVIKKSIRTLKRKTAFDILREELNTVDSETVYSTINNIDEVEDGIYELCYKPTTHCNFFGECDDVDVELVLVPFVDSGS